MSHTEETLVIEMNMEELATRDSQKDKGGQILKYRIKGVHTISLDTEWKTKITYLDHCKGTQRENFSM